MYSTMLYKAVFSFLISLDLLGFVPAPGTKRLCKLLIFKHHTKSFPFYTPKLTTI